MSAVEISSTVARDRRRSLKTLFQLPLFPRPRHFPYIIFSGRMSGTRISLPEDVLRNIVQRDELSPKDILSLSLMVGYLRCSVELSEYT
jgi:hypothetical protein